MDPAPSVLIVGAGAGGIATAARLAKRGCRVTVVEKNEFIGGRCSLIHRDGYVSLGLEAGHAAFLLTRGRGRDSTKGRRCC
ncbi:hypothetical protein CDD83_5068 [Cordyceps sp. RAO-2017]|nr:hypothetical protein CDD83_5068 [Cordyceps sp. RAO-2017]